MLSKTQFLKKTKEQLYEDYTQLSAQIEELKNSLNEKSNGFNQLAKDYSEKSDELQAAYDAHAKLALMYDELKKNSHVEHVEEVAKIREQSAKEVNDLKQEIIRLTDKLRTIQATYSAVSKNHPIDLVKVVNDVYALPCKKKPKIVPFKTKHIFKVHDDDGKVFQKLLVLCLEKDEKFVKGVVLKEKSDLKVKQFPGQLVLIDVNFLQKNQTLFNRF